MSRHDNDTSLRHMLDHAIEAHEMAHGKTRRDLETDRQLNLALVRLLEIVGEAASRASADLQERNPQVPWSQIVGLRNRLIHGYDSVDFDILWAIVHDDLPPLIDQLTAILSHREP